MKRILSVIILLICSPVCYSQTILFSNFFQTVGLPTAATPTFSPVAGSVINPTTVTASTSTTGCGSYIYFDTNSAPTTNQTTYSVTTTVTLYAYVHGCPGYNDSSITSAVFSAVNLPVYIDSPSCGFSTSCTATVSAGELVHMFCPSAFASTITSVSASSSPSATWAAVQSVVGGAAQSFWAVMNTSGSTTFSCTPTPGQTYAFIQLRRYSNGAGATVKAYAQGTNNTTATFSTTTPSITIICDVGNSSSYSGGTVGGHAVTNFVTSATGYGACADYTSTTPLTGVTSVLNTTGSAIIGATQSVSF
jgi:hypothetical protein